LLAEMERKEHRGLFFLMVSTGWLKRLRAPENAESTDERSSEVCCFQVSTSRGVCSPEGLGAIALPDSIGRESGPGTDASSLQSQWPGLI